MKFTDALLILAAFLGPVVAALIRREDIERISKRLSRKTKGIRKFLPWLFYIVSQLIGLGVTVYAISTGWQKSTNVHYLLVLGVFTAGIYIGTIFYGIVFEISIRRLHTRRQSRMNEIEGMNL